MFYRKEFNGSQQGLIMLTATDEIVTLMSSSIIKLTKTGELEYQNLLNKPDRMTLDCPTVEVIETDNLNRLIEREAPYRVFYSKELAPRKCLNQYDLEPNEVLLFTPTGEECIEVDVPIDMVLTVQQPFADPILLEDQFIGGVGLPLPYSQIVVKYCFMPIIKSTKMFKLVKCYKSLSKLITPPTQIKDPDLLKGRMGGIVW